MKVKNKFFIFILSIFIIFILIYFFIAIKIDIYKWKDFKADTLNNYAYVNSITIHRTLPIKINIIYNVNKILNEKEIEELFKNTTKYLLTDNVFQDLVKYHKKKYHNSFIKIGIYIHFREKNNQYDVEFMSPQSKEGEPNPSLYNEWYIEYNNGNYEFYKSLTY